MQRYIRLSSNAASVHRYTHDVINQAKPLTNYNMYDIDPTLQRAMTAFLPSNRLEAASKHLSMIGKEYGSSSMDDLAILAEKNVPKLKQFDNYGRRIDVIDYNPAYHALKKRGIEIGGAGNIIFTYTTTYLHTYYTQHMDIIMKIILEVTLNGQLLCI